MTLPVTPHGSIGTEDLTTILEIACRAPSLHNSQPWRWTFSGGVLRLSADHARVGHHTDITGREVILSCGAVLDHLQIAAAAAGWWATVDRSPDRRDRDHLASIVFHRAMLVSSHE